MSGGTLQWTECLCLSILSLHNMQALYSPSEVNAAFKKKNVRNVPEARDEGRRKIKRLLPVHCCGSSAILHPQVLTDGGDIKGTNQNTIHYSKIVAFLTTGSLRSMAVLVGRAK